jgi:hypothetical protein
MGTSFHYRGRLMSAHLLPKLVDEVVDVCQILKWDYDVFEMHYPENEFAFPPDDIRYGIIFSPEDCEPVIFIFDSEGRLFNPVLKDLIKDHEDGQIKIITIKLDLSQKDPQPEISDSPEGMDAENMIFNISVKTFFEKPESWVRLMEFIRYISEKYFTDFTLEDESQYWNSQSTDLWHSKWEDIHSFMHTFDDMIKDEHIESTEDFLSFIRKMAANMKKSQDKSDEENSSDKEA